MKPEDWGILWFTRSIFLLDNFCLKAQISDYKPSFWNRMPLFLDSSAICVRQSLSNLGSPSASPQPLPALLSFLMPLLPVASLVLYLDLQIQQLRGLLPSRKWALAGDGTEVLKAPSMVEEASWGWVSTPAPFHRCRSPGPERSWSLSQTTQLGNPTPRFAYH